MFCRASVELKWCLLWFWKLPALFLLQIAKIIWNVGWVGPIRRWNWYAICQLIKILSRLSEQVFFFFSNACCLQARMPFHIQICSLGILRVFLGNVTLKNQPVWHKYNLFLDSLSCCWLAAKSKVFTLNETAMYQKKKKKKKNRHMVRMYFWMQRI